jgi:hypothetical protein
MTAQFTTVSNPSEQGTTTAYPSEKTNLRDQDGVQNNSPDIFIPNYLNRGVHPNVVC